MSEFGRVSERKLRVNVGKSKVMRYSRCVNVGSKAPRVVSGCGWRM